ncbi:GHMP kinase [candidate division MSBL1 archaeon SCGC-AAA259A05]|uniref:Beta-ribofuranosylaminobenzene 5'-phosphate synthase n=1 Tax=candidate division MSBL1 archaeon SCGC-AAA259A05 TaxID=1698259 RepID=A0A133UAG4_9EURY|nr:GHMP kinase [candidate division MSBL1 archaeon SCGC-AAA259A05]
MEKVTVRAPAHLHVGNFDLSGDLGRLFGTVGFAIERPSLEIEVRKANRISSEDGVAEKFARRFSEKYDVGGAEIKVEEAMPKYVGLGYHTTLALSIGKALSELYGLSLSIKEVALAVRRGLITALGLYACKVGGFLVEGGFKLGRMEEIVPPLLFRRKVPETWYFVVAVPESSRKEIAEFRRRKEEKILRNLEVMSREMSAELSRLVLLKMMPSILEEDIDDFGGALTSFNSKLGKVWSKYQGGSYCNEVVEHGIEFLKGRAYCACQSSWGPTFYGIVDGKSRAVILSKELESFLEGKGGGETFYTKPRNGGLEWE